MVATYFKTKGFEEGKGLGANLQGKTSPRQTDGQLHTFGRNARLDSSSAALLLLGR